MPSSDTAQGPYPPPRASGPWRCGDFCLRTWAVAVHWWVWPSRPSSSGFDLAGVVTDEASASSARWAGSRWPVGLGIVLYRLGQAARRNLLWRVRRSSSSRTSSSGRSGHPGRGVLPACGLVVVQQPEFLPDSGVVPRDGGDGGALARIAAVELARGTRSARRAGLRRPTVQRGPPALSGVSLVSCACPPAGARPPAIPPPLPRPLLRQPAPTPLFGAWSHSPLPASIPFWVGCSGSPACSRCRRPSPAMTPSERGGWPLSGPWPSAAMARAVVDLPVDEQVRSRIRKGNRRIGRRLQPEEGPDAAPRCGSWAPSGAARGVRRSRRR